MTLQQSVKMGLLLSVLPLYCVCSSNARLDYSENLQENHFQMTRLSLPSGFHAMKSAVRNTSAIGTIEHPTIDGGQVSLTNGVPVNEFRLEEDKKITKKPPIKPLPTPNLPIQNSPPVHTSNTLEDTWVTNTRVKFLLKQAAEEGKLKFVLEKAEQLKLPATVAVVPMVESNYQNKAISPKGAVGVWQLMPSVAKDYGIQNHERFQLNTSTEVALKLIRDLHQQFGNWTLVFAAYNAGSQRVKTALEKKPDAHSIDELDLPQETKQYVKRIQAITSLLSSINDYEL